MKRKILLALAAGIIGVTLLGWAGFYDADGTWIAQVFVRGLVFVALYRGLKELSEVLTLIDEARHR